MQRSRPTGLTIVKCSRAFSTEQQPQQPSSPSPSVTPQKAQKVAHQPKQAYKVKSYYDFNFNSYKSIKKFSDLPQEFGYNQHIAIDNELRDTLRATLWKFKAPIRYAFAYGSGVFSQGAASNKSSPQVDLIFGVSHSQHWHSLNIKQYPEHYSGLRLLGSGAVSYIQDNIGAGMYFNPYVEINGIKVKYGVVNMDTVFKDLSEWNSLYVAGRLHKPVKILRDDPRARFLNQSNLISVLRSALLLLPENFTETELYTTIAGVSYTGDPRMQFGENPNKVRNIVENQFLNFRRLYSPLMDGLPNLELSSTSAQKLGKSDVDVASLTQDMDPVKRGNMVMRLPSSFRTKIYNRYANKLRKQNSGDELLIESIEEVLSGVDKSSKSCREMERRMATDDSLPDELRMAISRTVRWPSTVQSFKGIFTAGVLKSLAYSTEKLKKYNAGRQNKA